MISPNFCQGAFIAPPPYQGWQKPTGEGLTGYIRVLLGLMGKMGNMKLSY